MPELAIFDAVCEEFDTSKEGGSIGVRIPEGNVDIVLWHSWRAACVRGTQLAALLLLTTAQKAMVFAAKVLPQPVLQRLATLAARRAPQKNTEQQGE